VYLFFRGAGLERPLNPLKEVLLLLERPRKIKSQLGR